MSLYAMLSAVREQWDYVNAANCRKTQDLDALGFIWAIRCPLTRVSVDMLLEDYDVSIGRIVFIEIWMVDRDVVEMSQWMTHLYLQIISLQTIRSPRHVHNFLYLYRLVCLQNYFPSWSIQCILLYSYNTLSAKASKSLCEYVVLVLLSSTSTSWQYSSLR